MIATGSMNKRGEIVRMVGENERFDIKLNCILSKYVVNPVL